MKALVAMFQDNAMFYKDITQWLRNRTFGSLFFGLLLVAEALSLFIIAGSNEMSQPGISMFYILYMVLMTYGVIIAYLGNALTSREFVNRTFELFELSGMSLEKMIGGKVLSMLYQFFFGFFCLVPFMFFSYFLGGLDFFEMIVGVLLAGVFALPLYLTSLMMALMGRYAQVTILTRVASLFFMGWFMIFALFCIFSGEPVLREMVRSLTEFLKRTLVGDLEPVVIFVLIVAAYVQLCLLLFYFCCNSISRETDSREIPIKVLCTTLFLSWIGLFVSQIIIGGYSDGMFYQMTVPIYLGILLLALLSYYNRVSIPPIVLRRYRDAGLARRILFFWYQPGMRGGVRTILGLILLVLAAGFTGVHFATSGTASGLVLSSNDPVVEWWDSASLIAQIPWFLTVPYLLYIRGRDLRFNYPGQRALMVATWVITGALVMIYAAWTKANLFSSGGNSTVGEVALVILFSPLSSLATLDSNDIAIRITGAYLRWGSGAVGTILMLWHLSSVSREQKKLARELEEAEPVAVPAGPATSELTGIPEAAE